VKKLCLHLDEKKGESIELAGVFNVAIVNALWAIITGEKLQYDDPTLKQVNITILLRIANWLLRH